MNRSFLLLAFASILPFASFAQQPGLDSREEIAPFLNGAFPPRTPRSTAGSWVAVNAFPNLTFQHVLDMRPVPGTTDQLLVVEKWGQLLTFRNDPSVTSATTLLDIQPTVQWAGESGIMSVAFHPEYGQAGSPNRSYIYVFYRYNPFRLSGNIDPGYIRVSRFTWQPGSNSIDPNSELVLINQFDRHNWHNGSGMVFGDDGFLYIGIGDEGGSDDFYNSGQKRDGGLFSGIFRIDVDKDPTRSHPIRRQPTGAPNEPNGWSEGTYTQNYYIPNDNPWQSPGGSQLEEFYALGFRNPFRMSKDALTGQIWIGEVGGGEREEINKLVKGANYGWSYREGDRSGPKPRPADVIGVETDPVYTYPRSVGGCMIGGHVYRGDRFPDLYGKFVFADYNTGSVSWLRETGGNNPPEVVEMLRFPQQCVNSFALDHDGELYILRSEIPDTSNTTSLIFRLENTGQPVPEPPTLLSQTGAFSNLANLTPSAGIIPYDVIQPLWSDGATKFRWLAIPFGNEISDDKIIFSENGDWGFPEGSVLIKHFEMGSRRLETRFMVRGDDDQWYGMTYKWNAAGTDAELLPGPSVEETFSEGGDDYIWYYPSRTECFTCHTGSGGTALGVKTRHLNREILYPRTGRSSNQLLTLNRLGYFTQTLDETRLDQFLTAAAVNDNSATLELRARSYVDINCSQCHIPNGPTRATFDGNLTAPPFWQNLINMEPLTNLGISGAKVILPGDETKSILYQRMNTIGGCCAMPPLAKNKVDAEAVALMADWIRSLDPATTPSGPVDPTQAPADYTAPEAILQTASGSTTVGGPFQMVVQFNEPIVGLTASDFVSLNATVTQLSGSGSTWTAQVTPTSIGPGMIDLPSDRLTDRNGNANPLATPLTFNYTTGGTNSPPTLSLIPNQTDVFGEAVQLALTASDPNSDTLTWMAVGLPTGLTIDPGSGVISGDLEEADNFVPTITVKDGRGGTATRTFNWTVDAVADGLQYEYFQTEFEALPDFSSLTPDATGVVADLDLSVALRNDAYAIRYFGNIEVPQSGTYQFALTSDDGSKLLINGSTVIDNDGLHGDVTVSGSVNLTAGRHPFEVQYLEYYGSETLRLTIQGPGLPNQLVGASLLSHNPNGGVVIPGNEPPVFTAPGTQNWTAGTAVNLALTATDPDSAILTWSAAGLPAGMGIAAQSGTISGTPISNASGTATVTVDDGDGNMVSDSFGWTVTGATTPDGLTFRYYEQEYEALPNLSGVTPDKQGSVTNFDLSVRERNDAFVLQFEGTLTLPAPGEWQFFISSDDGSRLTLSLPGNQTFVVDNDGLHGLETEFGTVNLTGTEVPILVEFLEWYGSETLIVEAAGPGFPRQVIPDEWLGGGGDGTPNTLPKLKPITSRFWTSDSVVNLAVAFVSPVNDPTIQFGASGLPNGLQINETTGVISGSPQSISSGTAIVFATNGNNERVETTFAWQITSSASGIRYEFYDGEYEELPDFSTLTPDTIGIASGFDLSVREKNDAFLMRYDGLVNIPANGNYTFYLASDDGSRLYIDGTLLIDNGGLHGTIELSQSIGLTAGEHRITVEYLEYYGDEVLQVDFAGPGLARQPLTGGFLSPIPNSSGENPGSAGPGGSGSGDGSGGPGGENSDPEITANFQPDSMIGITVAKLVGDNTYSPSGATQTIRLTSKRARTIRGIACVENDGDVEDSFSLRGSRGNRFFRFQYLAPAGNITGEVIRGSYVTASLSEDDDIRLSTAVKPEKSKLRKKRNSKGKWARKKYTGYLSAISRNDNGKTDRVRIQVRSR